MNRALAARKARSRSRKFEFMIYQEARLDVFDSIECFYNPRKRRRLEMLRKELVTLTQPSVVSG